MKTEKQNTGVRQLLLATLALTICIGITSLNPEIALANIAVNAFNPVISNLAADTSQKATAKKPQHLAKTHTVRKPSHSDDQDRYSSADPEKKLQELTDEVERNSEKLNRYYNSDEFKATQREMEQKGKEMQEFYNKPELKQLQEELGNVSSDFSKNYGNNDETTKLSSKMGEIGRNIGAYFSSPEFKKMNTELENKYGIPHERHYYNANDLKDENYQKYQAELESKLPPEIKRQTDELKTMGEQIGARYETPEYKAQNKHMQALGDSLTKAYDNPAIKEQQTEMEKLGRQMDSFQNNPELKKVNEQLQRSIARMNAYMNSPEYQHYLRNLEKISFNFNDDNEKPEAPEKP
jgi:bla regulator protein BlaR1